MSSADLPQPWQRPPSAAAKLPDYAHPPLVMVTLAARFDDHLPCDDDQTARFERELGPAWQQVTEGKSAFGRRWKTKLGDQELLFTGSNLRYHWDGLNGDFYPHYPQVRDGFVAVWNAWCSAAKADISVSTWRVEYLNRITQGTVWQSLADLSFFRWLSPFPASDGLDHPKLVEHRWDFPLDRFDAELSISLSSGRAGDNPDELWLGLTSYGKVTDPDDTFLAGFDYGREVIVRTFRQLMQPAANQFWGLKG